MNFQFQRLKFLAVLILTSVACNLNAAIVYTNIKDTVELGTDTSGLKLDIDGDAVMDLDFFSSSLVLTFSGARGFVNTKFSANPVNSVSLMDTLVVNDNISSTSSSWTEDAPIMYWNLGSGSIVGLWNDNKDHYIGIRFEIGGKTHYGWILANVNTSNYSITIKEFAYEDTPGASIKAGDKGTVSTSNIKKEELKVILNPIERTISFLEINNSADFLELTLIDLNGKLVLQQQIEVVNKNLRVKLPAHLSTGIYISRLRNEDQILGLSKFYIP